MACSDEDSVGSTQAFSKEKREERKRRLQVLTFLHSMKCSYTPKLIFKHKLQHEPNITELFVTFQEELKKGHFDDFKQLRDTNGKVFQSSPTLLSKKTAQRFPSIVPYGRNGEPTDFPEHNGRIILVCAAFREGAQPMIDAWSKAFDLKFRDQNKAMIVEVSLVDSFVMSLWPFRSTILAQAAKSEEKYSMNSNFLFLFKDVDFFQRKLELPNRLIGYVFLLDTENLIRWKGCGFPDKSCLLYTSPSPRDRTRSRMPSSA